MLNESVLNSEEAKKELLGLNENGGNDNTNIPQNSLGERKEIGTPKVVEQSEGGLRIEIGYRNMAIETMPTKGRYYPDGTSIQYRGLDVLEIKHYSSMDENDLIDVETHINDILKKAVKIYMGGQIASYKDLKEADKLYMIFTIRDITMEKMNRKNVLNMPLTCKNNHTFKKEIDSSVFSYFLIPQKFEDFYDPEYKCYDLKKFANTDLDVYIPSIGTLEAITNYIKIKVEGKSKNNYYNKQFLTFLQFLVADWRELNTTEIDRLQKEFNDINIWPMEKHDTMLAVTSRISVSIEPSITVCCPEDNCGDEVTAPIRFPEGYRSIFNFSNISSRLFGDTE